ncbi:TetR/AcrR family transcriptional regulator [Baekduia soli]|uniref:TetR/AcrR family transcriptional regulator n=1 Tax=Baekduia soli TaxID=496014 RepID=UPI001652169F|nr:TetR/AcrR family transcriptional regulator [Baekduia soli]
MTVIGDPADEPGVGRAPDAAPGPRVPPRRGTRPRNRKALIIDAAAELFYERGYANVAMSEVANAVNVRASSLYRHFAGKSELLSAVLQAELTPFRAAAADATSLDALLAALATAAAHRPRIGVLWQRESRVLSREELAPLTLELHELTSRMTVLLRAERPRLRAADAQLLVWCALSILRSVANRGMRPSPADHTSLIADVLSRVLGLVPRHGTSVARLKAPWVDLRVYTPHSTRERLLGVAAPLLAASGYAGTSLEDIAARAGIAGPTIYHYFGSKQDLLFASLSRAAEGVLLDMHRALSHARDAADAVRRLSESYLTFATTNSALIDVLITDTHQLSGPQKAYVMQSQESFRAEWTHVLLQADPAFKPVTARAAVRATLAVIDDFARSPGLRRVPDVFPNLVELLLEIQRAPGGGRRGLPHQGGAGA